MYACGGHFEVYACGGHFEDDCFDSSWMLQSILTYLDRDIQIRLHPGAIPTKFPHEPVKERHFSYSSETINLKISFISKTGR